MYSTTIGIDDIKLEEQTIALAKKDPAQFRVLYEQYYKQIFLYIYRKLNDKEITADLCSQVFLKAMTNIQQYTHQGLPFSAWLYRIASNEVMQYFRHHAKVRNVMVDDDMVQRICEESEGPEEEELKQHIESIITALPIEEVELIELRFYEGKSYKEIAYIKNITEVNAKTKVWRIVEKIRKHIKNIR